MTEQDIIRMARDARFVFRDYDAKPTWYEADIDQLKRFAELVAVAEREECAKVCDERANGENDAQWCADTIRSRRMS